MLLRPLLLAVAMLGLACAPFPETKVRKRYSYQQKMTRGWSDGQFRRGLKHGRWVHYDVYGNKMSEGDFVDGVMHGSWTFYFEGGTAWTLEYANGVLVQPPPAGERDGRSGGARAAR